MNKPQSLSRGLIERIISTNGQHKGVFQVDSLNKKGDGFYSVYISDGYFKLKTLFYKEAADCIEKGQVAIRHVVEAQVKTYNFQSGLYVVRGVTQNWGETLVVGDPKNWQFGKVNANKNGGDKVVWPITVKSPNRSSKFKQADLDLSKNQRLKEVSSNKKSKSGKSRHRDSSIILKSPKSNRKGLEKSKCEEASNHGVHSQSVTRKAPEPMFQSEPNETIRLASNTPDQQLKSKSKGKSAKAKRASSKKLQFKIKVQNILSNGVQQPQKQQEQKPYSEQQIPSFVSTKTKQPNDSLNTITKLKTKATQQTKTLISPSIEVLVSQTKLQPHPEVQIPKSPAFFSSSSAKHKGAEVSSASFKKICKLIIQDNIQTDCQDDIRNHKQYASTAKATHPVQEEVTQPDEFTRFLELLKQDSMPCQQPVKDSHQQQFDDYDQIARLIDEETLSGLKKIKQESQQKVPRLNNKTNQPSRVLQVTLDQIHPSISSEWSIKVQLMCFTELGSNTKNSNRYAILKDAQANIAQIVITSKTQVGDLKENGYYQISRALIDQAETSKAKGCTYVITTTSQTSWVQILPFQTKLSYQLVYTPFSKIQSHQLLNQIVNVIAVVKDIQVSEYGKQGKIKKKRTITLADPISGSEIELMDFYIREEFEKFSVVSLFNLKVAVYKNTYQLSMEQNTILKQTNQALDIVDKMTELSDLAGLDDFVPKIQLPRTTIGFLKAIETSVLQGETSDDKLKGEVTCKIVSYQRNRIYYLSCPVCKKKVTERFRDIFYCPKCQTNKTPIAKFLVSGLCSNHEGGIHVILDEKLVQKLLGIKATEFYQLQKLGLLDKFNEYLATLQGLMGKDILAQIVGSVGDYNGRKSARYTIKYLQIIEDSKVMSDLLSQIKTYQGFL